MALVLSVAHAEVVSDGEAVEQVVDVALDGSDKLIVGDGEPLAQPDDVRVTLDVAHSLAECVPQPVAEIVAVTVRVAVGHEEPVGEMVALAVAHVDAIALLQLVAVAHSVALGESVGVSVTEPLSDAHALADGVSTPLRVCVAGAVLLPLREPVGEPVGDAASLPAVVALIEGVCVTLAVARTLAECEPGSVAEADVETVWLADPSDEGERAPVELAVGLAVSDTLLHIVAVAHPVPLCAGDILSEDESIGDALELIEPRVVADVEPESDDDAVIVAHGLREMVVELVDVCTLLAVATAEPVCKIDALRKPLSVATADLLIALLRVADGVRLAVAQLVGESAAETDASDVSVGEPDGVNDVEPLVLVQPLVVAVESELALTLNVGDSDSFADAEGAGENDSDALAQDESVDAPDDVVEIELLVLAVTLAEAVNDALAVTLSVDDNVPPADAENDGDGVAEGVAQDESVAELDGVVEIERLVLAVKLAEAVCETLADVDPLGVGASSVELALRDLVAVDEAVAVIDAVADDELLRAVDRDGVSVRVCVGVDLSDVVRVGVPPFCEMVRVGV